MPNGFDAPNENVMFVCLRARALHDCAVIYTQKVDLVTNHTARAQSSVWEEARSSSHERTPKKRINSAETTLHNQQFSAGGGKCGWVSGDLWEVSLRHWCRERIFCLPLGRPTVPMK